MSLNQPRTSIAEEDVSIERLFTLLDLDAEIANTPNAKVVNNSSLVSKKLSKEFADAIFSNSDGDLGFVPTCRCGKVFGLARKGLFCPECGTECSPQFVDSLSHTSWLGIPQQYSPVLHPIWYLILKQWTGISKHSKSVIDCILNPAEKMPDELAELIPGQGYQYFYDHADEIINILATKYTRIAKKDSTKNILTFMKHYRNVMFTRHLPVLHSSLHPLKCNGGTLKYTDNTSKEILSAIVDLSMITFRSHAIRTSQKHVDTTIYNIYAKVIGYYKLLITSKLGDKQALLRKHNFGSRTHFSARTVVTPHDKVLPMDEVILPWKMIVNSLKLQILNLLMHREGYGLEAALTKFMEALVVYDPDIDRIIQTIISEFPNGKMTIALGRNP